MNVQEISILNCQADLSQKRVTLGQSVLVALGIFNIGFHFDNDNLKSPRIAHHSMTLKLAS